MRERQHPRLWRYATRERIDDRLGIVLVGSDGDDVEDHTETPHDVVPAHAPAGMLLIGRENAISRNEREPLRDPVHPLGRTVREHQLLGLAAEERRGLRTDVVHRVLVRTVAEVDRIELELPPQRERALDDGPGRRAE